MIMITAILYGFFLVHVILCTTADGSERHQLNDTGNQTKASLSRENSTYQNNTNRKCLVTVYETDLLSLQQLARSKVVHVVELDLQFPSNTSNSMIKEWRWNVTNNVGREILSVLAMNDGFVTWTLDVGRKTTKVRVVDEPPGCATTEKELGDFIAVAILKQLSFVDEKEICFDKASNKSTQTRCCKFIGKDCLNYQCYVSVRAYEFVNILRSMVSAFFLCMLFGGLVVILHFAQILQCQWRTTNNTVQRQGYYQLTECPMSISSILCMLFWDGYGRFKTVVRRCLFVLIVFLFYWQIKLFSSFYLMSWFFFWAIFYPLSRSLDLKKLHSLEHEFGLSRILKLFSYLGFDIQDVYLSARMNVLGGISLITLPFNVKRWKKSLVRFYHKFIAPKTVRSSLKNKILLVGKTFISCLCYILFIFMLQVLFLLYRTAVSCTLLLKPESIIPRHYRICKFVVCVLEFACVICNILHMILFLIFTPVIVISLVGGFILNVVFFFPYIVYTSILTFYSWVFWASVEQQYAVLMRLIFDQNVNNNSNSESEGNKSMNNGSDNASVGAAEVNHENIEFENNSKNNSVVDIDGHAITEIVCVVSQELYDKIREHLLPYHGNLFCFVLKVFGISMFAYLTLTLVRIFQASNISSTVQALVTFSIGALPYIMNVVAAKKNEEEKDVWKEQLKHRVKPLVDKFTANNSELSRTELIIRHPCGHLHEENAEEERRLREEFYEAFIGSQTVFTDNRGPFDGLIIEQPFLRLHGENAEEEVRGGERSIETSCETIGGQTEFTANNPELSQTKLIIRPPRLHLRGKNTKEEMRGGERSIETSCDTIGGQTEFTTNNSKLYRTELIISRPG